PAAARETSRNPVDLSAVKWRSAAPERRGAQTQPAPETESEAVAPRQPGTAAEPAWQKFASAAPDPDGRPMIAVVIDDMGIDKRRSAEAISLARPVTLAFLPYATDLSAQVRAARVAGHELLVHLPMEARDTTHDPGPNALTTEIGDGELLRRLRWNLDRFEGYVGVNNHMGSRFTRDRHAMEMVMGELKTRGLLFLDSRTVADSLGPELAREIGVPFAARQVFLDNNQSAEGVELRLAEAERVARNNGYAIAIGHPHDGTLAALREWLPRAEREGFMLVPVSAVVRHNWAMERSTARQPG
ncbi:MAG TPA: divergent polysaccharide deacetylase family protein, partial [Alphaproteobacteria bacterium]|nr:divergent polysaccharide deacetylase family protein [Alphaproteobacteria bacterium]